jgi:hypothetical protein
MNSNPHNPSNNESASGSGEETLRLIARLPAPEDLEVRVHAGLRAAPERGPHRRMLVAGVSSRGRVLAWPKSLDLQSGWMRTAAAAAIVFVVAGGGWGVYMHVQQHLPAKVIAMPARMPAAGGFSSAGAMRTPDTLPGPTVPHPVKTQPAERETAKKLPVRSTATKPAAARPMHEPATAK